MGASMGWAAQFGAGTTSTVSNQFEVMGVEPLGETTVVESEGVRGTRSHHKEACADGLVTVGYRVTMEPRPDDLDFWLYYIFGTAKATNDFAMAETVPDVYTSIDFVAKVLTQTGMRVNTAEFSSGKQNQTLQMVLELQGKSEAVGDAGSFPAISSTLSTHQPFQHRQSVLTIGSAYEIENVTVKIDNALVLDRHNNSQTRTELPPSDRIVTLGCDNPFTSSEYALWATGIAGAAATLVYTNGAHILTFTFANLKKPLRSPRVSGRNQEIPQRCEFQAYMSGATKELVVSNVTS